MIGENIIGGLDEARDKRMRRLGHVFTHDIGWVFILGHLKEKPERLTRRSGKRS